MVKQNLEEIVVEGKILEVSSSSEICSKTSSVTFAETTYFLHVVLLTSTNEIYTITDKYFQNGADSLVESMESVLDAYRSNRTIVSRRVTRAKNGQYWGIGNYRLVS